MTSDFWLILIFIAAFLLWVAVKVIGYCRKSEQQWRQVDKRKLKVWEDD